ncbi:TPA: hypothetical protein ACX6PS_003448 [Photobacterium damselae]
MYAPIILFVYSRLEHTKKTIEALKCNYLAKESDLIIYSDGERDELDYIKVNAVRKYLLSVDGFKSIKIINREENYGLAKNIIDGVTDVINKYGKVIVLEDDIVTSPFFLKYMNDSLEKYKQDLKVNSISGCNYPVDLNQIVEDTYFLRIPLCWGWATWSNRWQLFSKDLNEIPLINKEVINYINFDGYHDYFVQAKRNYKGKLNTWFIFWYLASAKNKKLTLFPKYSLVSNIGLDGSGENCGESSFLYQHAECKEVCVLRLEVIESRVALNSHIRYFKKIKKNLLQRIFHRMNRVVKSWV